MTQRITDVNGYTTIPRNPISRVGVFPYSGRSIGAPPDQADRIFMVYRPEAELADPETLESFKLAPWTDDHAMLGNPALQEGLTNPEDKGVHGTIGEQVEYDPTTRTLYANLKLWSSKLAALVDAGKKELSCGFRCVYEFATGNFEGQPYDAIQRTIRGNHLASVPEGRMGPGVAVLDHLTFTFDAKEFAPMAKTTRGIKLAKKLGVAPAALAVACGMDGADAAVLAKWKATMDAEEEDDAPEGGADPTLGDIAAMLESVGPALAGINSAIAAIAGGGAAPAEDPEMPDAVDDMEPMMDAAGKPVMDPATGKPKMQKKAAAVAAPAADAVPPALAAMDASLGSLKATSKAMHAALKGRAAPAALVAMDNAITNTEKALAAARKPRTVTRAAMDALEGRLAAAEKALASGTGSAGFKSFTAALAQRDALYGKASAVVGAFDHAEMDTVAVAKYAMDKLGLKAEAGHEVVAVENYLAGRLAGPARTSSGATFGLDSVEKPDTAVLDFLAGKSAAA